ncbi:hypothetical protein ABZX95_49980, partial [Streptomyces sp. NPDC004232]
SSVTSPRPRPGSGTNTTSRHKDRVSKITGKLHISVWQWAWTPIQVVDRDLAEPDRFRILHVG